MEKKRKHIVVYWLFMIVLFLVVLLSQQLVASIMQGSLSTSKYGQDATFEILWAGLVLIIVLVFKNKYIFTQKRENFFSSLQYILPELLLSGFFVLISIVSILTTDNPLDIYSIFNLALFCLFIGIVEEFLCRGWLLNEFLERYSNTRKEIILSILFSSFIFGVIHFLNIGETQGFFETLVQVMNAAAGGVFLALVYYKTKNIWVVVATHAIWDFSLFLSQANSLGDCLAGKPTTLSVAASIVQGIVLIFAYLLFCYWMYRQTDLYQKEKNGNKDYLIGIGIAIYIAGLLFIHAPTDGEICPSYTHKSIESPYNVQYFYSLTFPLENTDVVLDMDSDTHRIWLRNSETDEHVYLTEDDDFYDYILVDNVFTYTIIIQTDYNVIYYGTFDKINMEDDEAYFNKVKNGLKKMAVPDTKELGTLNIEDDLYVYPMLHTELDEFMYFDSEGNLYMN